jgi:hypothetical protein
MKSEILQVLLQLSSAGVVSRFNKLEQELLEDFADRPEASHREMMVEHLDEK